MRNSLPSSSIPSLMVAMGSRGAAAGEAPPWTKLLPPSSPVREWGLPPRVGSRVPTREKVDLRLGTRGARGWGGSRERGSRPWISNGGHRHQGPAEREEDGVIQEWLGQLWFIPDSTPSSPHRRHGSRVSQGVREHLIWIRKSLWEAKSFKAEDCFPVGGSDKWIDPPKQLNFAEDCWAKGVKQTFVQAVKAMAGRGRGRG